METLKLTKSNEQEVISKTIAILKKGGLVVFPTDTVYGLLADSTNPKVIDKLLQFKDRPSGKAISIFVSNKKMAKSYVNLNPSTTNIINNLLPGPFTVICESLHKTDLRLEAENKTLGFRIPDFLLIINLVNNFGKPLTATSANMSGKSSCYSISGFLKSISVNKRQILDLIVDFGTLPPNKPSTVIDTTSGTLKTLRLGDFFPSQHNILVSNSEEDTLKLGRFLASKFIKKSISRPLIFLLQGELGSGKTIFAKGVGKALEVKEEIVSPTYTISYEYDINYKPVKLSNIEHSDIDNLYQTNNLKQPKKNKLIHFDLYRIESEAEFNEICFIENMTCGNIYVVEWSERIPKTMITALKSNAEIVYIKFKHCGKEIREICWTPSV